MVEQKAAASKKSTTRTPKMRGVNRDTDTALGWVEREYPQLEAWRALAVEWFKGETAGIQHRLSAVVAFFERYLIQQKLPLDPAVFLARNTALPDFYRTACPDSRCGVEYNNHIHAFLHFVLMHKFSSRSDYDNVAILPDFHNPVLRMSNSDLPTRSESVHSPLPYGYIEELRQMLAAGPHFRDWLLAQTLGASVVGRWKYSAHDWFEVTEDQLDRDDPDCVWRERSTPVGKRVEIWSPVRWVALLVKLILPLRTFQVRMLDSGEADTWRYAAGNWTLNLNRLAQGSERRPLQQGVFRRNTPFTDRETAPTVLYINTNKTADIIRSGSEKGYLLPWFFGGPVHQDVHYWLEKLRDWQEKYNPISQRTAWAKLDGRHMDAKSDVQLAGYPDACFLFRMPTGRDGEQHLPIREKGLNRCWFLMLEALELRLAKRGETYRNGAPIRFLPPVEEQNMGATTLFPLHSLRVSLITAFALEGQIPFSVLQKLVGHSRLLMTLYYIKPGASHVSDVLRGAIERLESNKESSIQSFLLDTEHNELLERAICNSVSSLAAAVPPHQASRNPAGWMPMHHGLCLVGGNTSEIEGNGSVGGCYNGGQMITKGAISANPKYGHVPGGSRNCVRCRWFVTEPHYLPALASHFNTLAYHFDEARNTCLNRESELQNLKKQKADTEEASQPFPRLDAYRQAERVWESAMKRFSDLAEDLVACWRLIDRCKAVLEAPESEATTLVAAGTVGDVHIAIEEVESELLQLAGVCESVEVYGDLEPGKAVFRRSQLLDAVLYRENLPPAFMLLNEQEQLVAGNAFIRRLAHQMNPGNPALGHRQVIHLMDAGVSLSQHFDMDLSTFLPTKIRVQPVSGRQIVWGDDV